MRAPDKKEESMNPCCLSSTNWLVADGSLEGSISFETSSAEGVDVNPIGVLLERPADSPPCEITIFFRERHDLHSIYVRSSARVYEVYYASDSEVSSNEYLCTVRCGAALQEEDKCERVLAEGTAPNGMDADLPTSNTNNVIEDGWVEVDLPVSFLPENGGPSMSNRSVKNICPKTQIQYEATAEISDASPCMSITLRFLSLQIKTFVHIDEIYIYADPVEDTDPDPSVSNHGAGSLLSMLVPSLLQLSKSGTSGLQHKGFSDVLAGPKYLSSTEGTVHAACPAEFEMSEVEASTMMGNSKVGLDQQHNEEKLEHPLMASSNIARDLGQALKTKTDENNGVRSCLENLLDEPVVRHAQTKPGDGKLRSAEEEKGLNQSRTTINNEANAPYVLEKVLDDLVSRMGKIENAYLSFHESILKPLTGIEMRLQRMEEKLDAFSKAPLSSETYSSTWTSRLSAHESSFENEVCESSSAVVDFSSHEQEASADLLMVSSPGSKISGLVVKAPEFLDDDDDEFNIGYSVDLTPNEYPKTGKRVSIDSSIASALAAFVTSTTDISSPSNSHPMDAPNEQQNCADHFLDSAAAAVHSGTDRNSLPEWFLGDKNGEVLYETRDEMCQSKNSCSDAVDLDNTLNKFDMFYRTGEKVQGNYLCDEYLLANDDDDSPAEILTHKSKGLIITAPEFPNEDDILDCCENIEPHASNSPNTHSHLLPHSGSTPLALFLSSRKVSPSKSTSNSHDDPLELSTSDRNTTYQAQGVSYGNTAAESSLVGWFLSHGGGLPEQLDIFHDTAVIGEEDSSFIRHIKEDPNHVLKCDGSHSNGMGKGCTFTQNLLPCNRLHTDRSSIRINDKECSAGNSEARSAEGPIVNSPGEFEAADNSTPSGFDDIFMRSKLHPEYSDSHGMDCSIGALMVTGQNGGQTNGNSGRSSETTVQRKSRDGTDQMKPLYEPKQMTSFIPGQDDLTSNVEFCADEDLITWLPLEILLGQKQDDDLKKNDSPKLMQECSVSNLELSDLRSELPPEVPLDKNPYDSGNGGYNKQHNSPLAHNCEIADNNSLLDIEDNVIQSEISSMVMTATVHYPSLFSSLI